MHNISKKKNNNKTTYQQKNINIFQILIYNKTNIINLTITIMSISPKLQFN